jgi:hypothetical protein
MLPEAKNRTTSDSLNIPMNLFLIASIILLAHSGLSQCPVLQYVSDSSRYEGVPIRYVQEDSSVVVEYAVNGSWHRSELLSFDCNMLYLPAIPKPRWRNDDYICFSRGCGSSCFSNTLLPLTSQHKEQEGGQFLIDTATTLFMSMYLHPDSFKRILEINNCSNGKSERFELSSNDFPCAIPFECLDYSPPHKRGFTYNSGILTLYIDKNTQREFQVGFELLKD